MKNFGLAKCLRPDGVPALFYKKNIGVLLEMMCVVVAWMF